MGQVSIPVLCICKSDDEAVCKTVVQVFGTRISAPFKVLYKGQLGAERAKSNLDGFHGVVRRVIVELKQNNMAEDIGSRTHEFFFLKLVCVAEVLTLSLSNRFSKSVTQNTTMKITIADIAEKAGVSKATVSRVLNNRPEGVGPETRIRIQKILSETGFRPSGVARGLATGKSRSVGLIIPDIANPF